MEKHGLTSGGLSPSPPSRDLTGRFELVVKDDGIGMQVGPETGRINSFGLSLVKRLASRLHGSFTVDRDSGTVCRVKFSEEWEAFQGERL